MTQQEALAIMQTGVNVYLTGSAGSGKTYILNQYISYLQEHEVGVAVTASTGIAATHMHGMTIHAWSGIGIRDTLTEYDIDQMEQKPYLWKRYEKTKVLIIDEVSMLHASFLDTLDQVCQSMKRSQQPFGGIQIILSGDMFQLPPVTKNGIPAKLVTTSQAWKTMGLAICYLEEQHRQDDTEFTSILNAIRDGQIDESHQELLSGRLYESANDFPDTTKLFTHNIDVDAINNEALKQIDDDEKHYVMQTKGKEQLVDLLKRSCLAQETLVLKRGAQVMFIKNNSERGYVNGTRGIVESFSSYGEPRVRTRDGVLIEVTTENWTIEDNGVVKASITQLPLRHAWAITIHKSQGMSLDEAVIDLSKSFVSGMGYVALSRVRRLSGLYLLGLNNQALMIDSQVRKEDSVLRIQSDKAVVSLASLTSEELQKLHEHFIVTHGGVLIPTHKSKQGVVSKKSTIDITLGMIQKGKSIQEIATERNMTLGTIISHLEDYKTKGGESEALSHLKLKSVDMKRILNAFTKKKDTKLTPTKILLEKEGYRYDFETLRIARLFL